jgi:hypothetical protein
LTKQQKDLTEGLSSMVTNYEREIQANDQEIVGLQVELEELEVAEGNMKFELAGKITNLENDLCDLKQEVAGKASAYAAQLQRQFEQLLNDDLQKCRARVVDLAAENQKLYAQLSVEDDLGEDDLSDEEHYEDDIALHLKSVTYLTYLSNLVSVIQSICMHSMCQQRAK